MKHTTALAAFSLALSAAITPPASAAEAAPANGEQILKAMSAKLAASKNLSFHARREIDATLLEGRNIAEKACVEIKVSRPNLLSAHSSSRTGGRRFITDGRGLTVVDEKHNHYAQVPMATSIDGLVEKLDEHYGFIPPLADFAVSNPYRELRQQAHTVTYVGREKAGGGLFGLGGVLCDRIALKGKVADADLWIAVGDQLPRKMVATFTGKPGNPQLRICFSHWNLAAPLSASDFVFTPAKGALKVEMWSTARMQASSKR